MMELRLLRYFLAAAREENITHAAQSLHISQPSLSRQLMELEREIGKPLFVRGRRKLTLTEEGVLLRRRADEMLTLLEKTERELRAGTKEPTGEVAIGGTPTASVLQAAALTRAQYPGVHFQFYSSDAIDVLERLEHGSLDFVLYLQPVDPMQHEYISLLDSSRWGLLMPSDCALAQKTCVEKRELLSVPLILHRRAGLQRLITRWAGTEPQALHIAATYNVVNGTPSESSAAASAIF